MAATSQVELTQKQTVHDLDLNTLSGKRVLVRVDFNVPMNDAGEISDDSRIQESLPTLRHLLEHEASLIVLSHLGRPKGKVDDQYSLALVAKRLQLLLGENPVQFIPADESGVLNEAALSAAKALQPGELLLLDNIRFEPGEEKNDPTLAQKLAALAPIYVNDAFGSAHRAHASTEGVAHYTATKVAGLLMEKEIKALSSVVSHPKSPFVAIIGGSKVSTKITVLESLLNSVDILIIGGGMIFTFLRAQGISVGTSLVEDDFVQTAKDLLAKAAQKDVQVLLAHDLIVADVFKADAKTQLVHVNAIPDGWMGLDIGPQSIAEIQQALATAKTVLWNGPLGVFEFPAFATGTHSIAEKLAELTEHGHCQSVLGGGDTVAAVEQFKIDPARYTHVSTGGGASLEFIEGKLLPGIAALDDA